MIRESYVWKKELKKELNSFEKFLKTYDIRNEDEEYQDRRMLKTEKFFYVTSFIIRKLIEAKKITNSLVNKKINCVGYKKIYREPRLLDFSGGNCDIDKNYNLNKELDLTISILDLCNMFIHSYVFCESVSKDFQRLEGVFVNSINTKNKYCYYVTYKQYKEIILDFVNNAVVEANIRLDKNKNVVVELS